jgi:hypothetical protein
MIRDVDAMKKLPQSSESVSAIQTQKNTVQLKNSIKIQSAEQGISFNLNCKPAEAVWQLEKQRARTGSLL